MKKKGFTLIELLAVIVILAIIALIAVPIVMNVIENSKKRAAERSAVNYVHAVETAVATKKLNGPVEDGTYTVQTDGNLCLYLNNSCIDANKIVVETKGDKPKKDDKLKIQNYQVVREGSSLTIGGYPVSYNTSKKTYIVAGEKVEDEETNTPGSGNEKPEDNNVVTPGKICSPVKTATLGNVPTGEYGYGDEYVCQLADGVKRIFFVLEDGDKPNPETAGAGEVSLIMNQNFTDGVVSKTLKWCIDGGSNNATCKNINSKEEGTPLKHIQDTFGDSAEVSFPTKDQVVSAFKGSIYNLPKWLYYNLNGAYGYWTTTPYPDRFWSAWRVTYEGVVNYGNVDTSSYDGLRPVITISKNDIG